MGRLSKLVRGLDPRWGWVGLLVVYGLVYARALGHGFVWDDHSSVVDAAHFEAPLVRGLRSTQHDFLDRSILHNVQLSVPYESYRPLLFLSYSLDDALFGRSAVAMHAHNLLLGMACALLAGWVCSLLLSSSRLGLCAAALFALHPLQTEVVCYVSARGDLLCACFALLASGPGFPWPWPSGPWPSDGCASRDRRCWAWLRRPWSTPACASQSWVRS
jgi:hypothetical protein